MKLVSQSATHHQTTTNAIYVVEGAARECYQSKMSATPIEQETFIRKLIRRGHETPLEFASTTFRITTDRGIMAELTRHRHASFCVESTRYVKYNRGIRVCQPHVLPQSEYLGWKHAVQLAETAYITLLENGVAPQVARDVLPLCAAVDLRMCANWREWRHILRLRTASGAHPKMRELMGMVLEWFRASYPVIVEDIP